ncbi:MAG: hypothetical protein HQK53_18355 [Oligoflexia bacterium]|nr:hypothetical protein [Oligoflexia bacterium]
MCSKSFSILFSKSFKMLLIMVVVAILGSLFPVLTFASGPFKISVTNYGTISGQNISGIAAIKSQIDTVFQTLENDVNTKLPDTSGSDSYLRGMSDAGVIALKGLGVDYASDPDVFVVGVGAGAGVDVGNNSFSDLISGKVNANHFRGFGAQLSLMGGINLGIFPLPTMGIFDPKKLSLFMNVWKMSIPKLGSNLTGKLSNFGMHAQYKILGGMSFPFFFRWGGIDITTGLDVASMDLTYIQDLNKSTQQTITVTSIPGLSTNPQLTATYAGQVKAGAKVSEWTVPIEVSSNVQLLYFLTFFGGLGMDLNGGKSTANANVGGNVTAGDSTGYINGINATTTLDLGREGKPRSMNARWFAGTQLNFWLVKLYAQINHGIGQNTWGANLGLRVAY